MKQEHIKQHYKHNKIILVDSSGGEVDRPKIDSDLPIGITDINDPLNSVEELTAIFKLSDDVNIFIDKFNKNW